MENVSQFISSFYLISLGASGAFAAWILWKRRHPSVKFIAGIIGEVIVLTFGFIVLATTLFINPPLLDLPIKSILFETISAITGALLGVGATMIAYKLGRRLLGDNDNQSGIIGVLIWLPLLSLLVISGIWIFQEFIYPHKALIIEAIQLQTTANPDSGTSIAATIEAQERAAQRLVSAKESLPEGFTIRELLPPSSLMSPTAFTLGNNGEVYIATLDGIVTFSKSSPEGSLDTIKPFAPDIHMALGLVFRDGVLYAAVEGRVDRLEDTNGDGIADMINSIVEGLPVFVYDAHGNNGMAFGTDGRLYFTLGGTSDHGPEDDEIAGSILVLDLESEEMTVYASGFRNPYDLTFCLGPDGRLFASDNGPDRIADTLIFRPPDEVNMIEEGKHYGYPDFFGYSPLWAEDSVSPIVLLPFSAAATGIACYDYTGQPNSFPEEYDQNLFVTLYGSLVIPEQTGKKLVRIQLDTINGQVVGSMTDFFAADMRPIDVIQYEDGSLLILVWDFGQVYQIVYEGN